MLNDPRRFEESAVCEHDAILRGPKEAMNVLI